MGTSIQSQLLTMRNATEARQYESAKERAGTGEIDKNAFLRLMTEQLRHQDPMNPMDNSQFLNQTAMFTQIEEIQNLSKSLNSANALSQSSALIGKQVTVMDPDDNTMIHTGVVDSANISDKGASIEIGGMKYPLDLVIRVENPTQ